MNLFAVALAAYEMAVAHFAELAGTKAQAPISSQASKPDISAHLTKAQSLALPAMHATTGAEPPVLASIVGRLYGKNYAGYYAPQVISVDAALPQTTPPTDMRVAYGNLWRQFEPAYQATVRSQQPVMIQERNVYALLHRYTWAVAGPRTAGDPRDAALVSLFDHARVTAALAVCLAARDPAEPAPALLLGGDLSGVQDWLYTFGSQGAAKSLRGRSFYLQLISEVIAHFVLDRLELPIANLLYAGGGNFYVLVPTSLANQIGGLRQAISRNLLAMHEGTIDLALAAVPMTEQMLTARQGQTVGAAWQAVHQQLARLKAQRFATLTPAEMSQAIGSVLENTGLLEDTCAVCRRPIGADEEGRPLENGNGARKCDLCLSFEQLGNLLRGAEYLILSRLPPQVTSRVTSWQSGLRAFGYDVQLKASGHDETQPWTLPRDADLTTIYHWQSAPDVSGFPGHPDPNKTVWAFRPLAQCTPLNPQRQIATFDELRSDGIPRWGVLRMDVDNLGRIFQTGIPAGSLTQVVGLSSLLRLFFEGHVPQLAQTVNDHQGPRLYLMYAGGDDLFVVGGWSELPPLAQAIQREFTRFACAHPDVTISGGITIAQDANFPLYQAARAAGRAEDLAKDNGRNSLAFLDQPLRWGEEFERVSGRVEQLAGWLSPEGGKLPRTFLMTLQAIDAEWKSWRKQEMGNQPRYQHTPDSLYLGPWQWHLVYSLRRAAERIRDQELAQAIGQLITSILGGEITTIGMAARWAELLTRTSAE